MVDTLEIPAKPRPSHLFKKGQSGNPGGRNGYSEALIGQNTWAPDIRAKHILEKYTPAQILAFAKDIKKAPLSTSDAIVVIHLANILERDGIERERLYDRTFGKVPDKTISLNLNVDVDAAQLSDKALSLLGKLTDADDNSDLTD